MHSSEIIKQLIIKAKQNLDIVIVWLYGSRATGMAHQHSDYDIAVAFKNFIQNDPMEKRLRPECLALDWQHDLGLHEFQLSVVDINQAPIPLAWEIIQAEQMLYTQDENRLWQEIRRIHSRMEIDYAR